jgi:pimeloyl-ACP methyl ester carboxylesterase
MKLDEFSSRKRFADVGQARVAYVDEGVGPPVLLLHGCPFSSFIWRKIVARLRGRFRCIAPDLLGLGDTETPPEADWSVRSQARMISAFLDALALDSVHVVGHDQGGAVAQVLAADHPERVRTLVLCNAEAYDNWPSAEELPFVKLTQAPGVGPVLLWLLSFPTVTRFVLSVERAFQDRRVLTPDLVRGYVRANMADAHKRAKTRRYLARQMDPANQRSTVDVVERLRRLDRPVLLLWGKHDPHFGPEWAKRLRRDIPAVRGLELLDAGHMLMEEKPDEFAAVISDFFAQHDRPARARTDDLRPS